MRDLPCAGDGSFRPGFSCPRIFSSQVFSYRVSAPTLTRVHATGQERHSKPESSAAKALLLTSSGARVQESKSSIAYIFRSQSARALLLTSLGARSKSQSKREQESKKKNKKAREEREKEWQNPVPFKENYPPPRTYYSLIGCSPSAQLSSRERQNTWWENCPCTCADYVHYLEHSCQRHLVMANVRVAPHTFQMNSVFVRVNTCQLEYFFGKSEYFPVDF
jgi:hypothetical protein